MSQERSKSSWFKDTFQLELKTLKAQSVGRKEDKLVPRCRGKT